MPNKEYAAELRKPAIETVRKPLTLSTEAAVYYLGSAGAEYGYRWSAAAIAGSRQS